jgi:hypothetical protein
MTQSAGYSKRALVDKLGLRPEARVWLINPPDNYQELLGGMPPGVVVLDHPENDLDFIHFFTTSRAELEARFPEIKQSLAFNGTLWISWPKRAAQAQTDLSGNLVREIGLDNGLVDVKISAIDQIWSGLKFVYRLKDRPGK